MREIALYPSVKRFLEAAGFAMKGEVCGCDIVAVRKGELSQLAIVEMKRGFNLDLPPQAVDRMRASDERFSSGRLTPPNTAADAGNRRTAAAPRTPCTPCAWRPGGQRQAGWPAGDPTTRQGGADQMLGDTDEPNKPSQINHSLDPPGPI